MGALRSRPLPQQQSVPHSRVLLVQVDSSVPSALHSALKRGGFQVVARPSVREALKCLATDEFSALVCDLHLPAAGDGFTLVNAMRHFHPAAITMIMSDYPALRESVSALVPMADEVLVTPAPPHEVVKLLKNRLQDPKHRVLKVREPVATILERHSTGTIREWLARVDGNKELAPLSLSDESRTGHLRTLLVELVQRLREPRFNEGKAKISMAALAHGRVRSEQGYTAAMLVEESRILQVCIFQTLRNNLSAVDLALVLTDVMTIADEVDSQLKQTMTSFSEHRDLPKRGNSMTAAL
jgi:ActR/RegA family two-component response regulator